MKKTKNEPAERLTINASEIPLESNLGLLAYGDLAFSAWRQLKKAYHKQDLNEKK